MCAICLAIFETEEQWRNHQDFGTCSARNTPEKPKKKSKKKRRRAKRYCRTCRTLFNSERYNDLHEPCPGFGEVGSGGPCTSQRHTLESPSNKGPIALPSTIPANTRIVRTATTYGQYSASTSMENPVRPRKRKCDGQGEENHDSDSGEGSIVRKARPVDKSKTSSPSDEIQIDHNQNMLKLPKGISSVTVTSPGPGQPIRIKLPLTEPNQNWCTIRVNVPEQTVTCSESNLALSVQVLKKTADLAEKEKNHGSNSHHHSRESSELWSLCHSRAGDSCFCWAVHVQTRKEL
jgi:hypothetical protein